MSWSSNKTCTKVLRKRQLGVPHTIWRCTVLCISLRNWVIIGEIKNTRSTEDTSAILSRFFKRIFWRDGSSYSYYDPVFPKSFRFYLSFTSASPLFISWLREELHEIIGVKGSVSKNKNNAYLQLKYAKTEAMIICKNMYDSEGAPRLNRKYKKILDAIRVIEKSRSGEIGRRAAFRAQWR